MTLAQRFSRLIDNRVHAAKVSGCEMISWRFLEGDWVLVNGELRRVWMRRNDEDALWLY